MSHPSAVQNVLFDAANSATNGPASVDRRTKSSGLIDLSAGIITFTESGATDPWTLPYEEVIYVIEGHVTVHHDGRTIEGHVGDVLTLEKGITVVYEGTSGTRAFFALVPANWLEQLEQ